MTTPTPLTNIIYYGFFTTDLTATVPSSTFVQPTNFTYQTVNENDDSGVLTYVYLQNIVLSNNNLTSSFKRIDDSDTLPAVLTFTGLSSTPVNNSGGEVTYNNLTLLNTSNFYYISTTKNYKYPKTGFLYNFSTTTYTFDEYINTFQYVPITSTVYTLTSIDDFNGLLTGTIQVNIGAGNILPGYLGSTQTQTIYNPFLPNQYNNNTATGNKSATGWIIYSTNY